MPCTSFTGSSLRGGDSPGGGAMACGSGSGASAGVGRSDTGAPLVVLEAQADAHTMLALIAEQDEGADAALPHVLTCLELAGNDRQRMDAHDNLSKLYGSLGETAKQQEHQALHDTLREAVAASEAGEARQKASPSAEESADDALPELPSANGGEDGSGDAVGDAARPVVPPGAPLVVAAPVAPPVPVRGGAAAPRGVGGHSKRRRATHKVRLAHLAERRDRPREQV